MPPIRVAQHARPAPAPVEPAASFTFPKDHHLVITTEQHVWSWDRRGLTNAFHSGSGGILAAKEAKDGSGLLAVADSHVVVLHDANRGMDRSYRLKGTEGQIRLLEYSNDSKSLFFTTTLQNAVQSYSLGQSCLLEPAHTHPSPPTVLAISSTSHLLLSASENPPTVYIQNQTLRTPALLLQPRASSAAVTTASFHPERPNVFLLAFKDGTLAAYDATRILGKGGRGGSGGEIGRFKNLHIVTNRVAAGSQGGNEDDSNTAGSRSVGIASAAFLPGHRSRAVSVGGDGRCRLVDFDCGGNILRTWHIKGPATSLSVLSVRQKTPNTSRSPSKRTASTDSKNNTIAVGRQDGKVLLFDSVGLLLSEQTVDSGAGRIIDVAWMKGLGLKSAATNQGKSRSTSETTSSAEEANTERESDVWPRDDLPSLAALDEEQDADYFDETGTVNYKPVEGLVHRGLPSVGAMNYMDLFSPVKRGSPPKSPQRRSPRPRARPRILSSTFRQSSLSDFPGKSPVRLSLVPPTLPRPDSKVATVTPEMMEVVQLQDAAMRLRVPDADEPLKRSSPLKQNTSPSSVPAPGVRVAKTPSKTPRPRKNRRVSNVRMPGSYQSSSNSLAKTSTSSNSSKILADIRRLGDSESRKRSGLALLAPYMNPRSTPISQSQAKEQPKEAEPPANSNETVKPEPAARTEDIWLTSDDEGPASQLPSRGRRQPSRRLNKDNDTLKGVPQMPQFSTSVSSSSQRAASVANSENSENSENVSLGEAQFHSMMLAPDTAQSPCGPVHVEEYFTRTSSLAHDDVGRAALGDLNHNTVYSPRPRSSRKSGLFSSAEVVHEDEGSREHEREACECGKKCCISLRKDVRAMGEELRMLRRQMEEMRALMGR